MPQRMRAVYHETTGPVDVVLRFGEWDLPEPAAGEVLVEIHAVGLNPVDVKRIAGLAPAPAGRRLVPGDDGAGVILAVGPGVSEKRVGQRVWIYMARVDRDCGTAASHAVVPSERAVLLPDGVSFEAGACLGVPAITAHHALFCDGPIEGQTVLIHGGAGNVGAFAVQLAKLAEARVIATASARDADYVRDLGADVVVNFHATRFEEVAHNVDVVIDLVGADVQARSFAVLRPGGLLVSTVSQPDQDLARSHGVRAVFFLVDVTTMHLTRLAEMIDAGELTTNVGAVLPLADARVAHEMLEGTRARPRGKIVLQVNA